MMTIIVSYMSLYKSSASAVITLLAVWLSKLRISCLRLLHELCMLATTDVTKMNKQREMRK
jgi:hypothetical protein